ncbi:MAG: o-succinylbenzoate--CoA ligase, partial [Anaerolineae bacterium]
GWQMADCGLRMATEKSAIRHSQSAIGSGSESGAGLRGILSVDRTEQPGVEALEDLPARAVGFREGRRRDLDEVQSIVFTSGTTGRPKGAMLTYGNHMASATASAFRLGTLPGDRWLACMPLYHVGGLAIVLRCCLYGTTLVLHDGFDPASVSAALDTQAVTLISLVPTMLRRLLEARGKRPFPESLRCVLLGGAAAPATLVERSLAFGVPVATTYGLTEAASQVATASPDDVRRKAGSSAMGAGHFVGRPLMFSQVRIAGADGHDRPPGEIGEIEVRGPTVMAGYYHSPEATREAVRNGWLRTGDMGYLDVDGDLWVVQRRSDLIVTGGENVYPAEVERVIVEHPGVEAACVIGVEDEEWGQRVVAAVVTAEGATVTDAELLEFCRARLAGYKQPRAYRFLTSLPQTASGKVQRDAVANWFPPRRAGNVDSA